MDFGAWNNTAVYLRQHLAENEHLLNTYRNKSIEKVALIVLEWMQFLIPIFAVILWMFEDNQDIKYVGKR